MDSPLPPELHAAYARCGDLARSHYENFPVASLLLPAALRPHVAALYAFARTADDFADEPPSSIENERKAAMSPIALAKGDEPTVRKWRLRQLDAWERGLRDALKGRASHPYLTAFAHTIKAFGIPLSLPLALLKAFRMDVTVKRYKDWPSLLHYCRHSADPVGRMVLLLHGIQDQRLHRLSDSICTGLQLINFWQDTAQDLFRGRIYYPASEMKKTGVREKDLLSSADSPALRALAENVAGRTEALFRRGLPLLEAVPGRLGLELRATFLGGLTVLNKLKAMHYNVLRQRPRLGAWDKAKIGFQVLFGR